ncbi:MAG: hypothetical protein HYZ72_08600 [Deltaproteobacteria bacterium]|nr:hypothetical protein [Deltaproteobacteria bacterium]
MANGDKKTHPHENRWWVDQGKSGERIKPEERQAPVGALFFRSVEDYDQERAREHLTDLNLKLLAQANPAPGQWAYLPLLPERSPAKEIEKVKRALPLPPDARAVLVDSGLSLRAIITGTPPNERVLEFNFIDEASFDCWIRGEWVCEEVFKDKHRLLQHAAELLRRYLEKDLIEHERFFSAPRPQGALPPARTEW